MTQTDRQTLGYYESLTLFDSSGWKFGTLCRFFLSLRRGFHSVSKDVKANRVKSLDQRSSGLKTPFQKDIIEAIIGTNQPMQCF